MAILLVTGSPGAGKTLWTVTHIVNELLGTGRPIVSNIAGLRLDGDQVTVVDHDDDLPLRWWKPDAFEDGTIFVFDECQRHYPPRNSMSKVPIHISEFETHRHRGFDFVFVTQGPRLIDRHLHDLVGRHVHLYRAFNMNRSRLYDWNAINLQPNPVQSKSTALVKTFAFPKAMFQHYKSASTHTMDLRIPWKVVVICVASVLFLGFMSWMVYRMLFVTQPFNVTATLEEDAAETATAAACDVVFVGRSGGHLIFKDRTHRRLQALPESVNDGFLVIQETDLRICGHVVGKASEVVSNSG